MNLCRTRTLPPPCFSIEVKWFLHGGVNWPQNKGNNALHFAFGNNKFDIVDELLSYECGSELLSQKNKVGSLRGRVCGGRVACVVGDGSKERSAESGPRGRGTWLRMARRRGLIHIKKSSLASALDRARQHVMGVSPVSSFEESSGGYTGHVRKVWEFVAWRGPRWN
ncbi:hypothetical protein TNCV_2956781 [Trichonephila clavipes]|nr:hypothetical protein TNCV_2956781 [Trichonephila clavipes]